MALTGDIYKFIDTIAPFKNQEEWDNSGFLVGDEQQAVTKAMVVLDITSDVVDEAIISGARMIISHHPIIFSPIKAVTAQTQPIVYKLVKHGISAVCAHTSLDVAKNGVNDVLAKALGLKNIKGLKTTSTSEYCKVVVFVPKRYAEDVKKAMTEAGAGNYGEYTDCTFEVAGKGSFMPAKRLAPL